jgi:hypothetical protein
MVATTANPVVIAAIAEQFLRYTELSDDPVLRAILSGNGKPYDLLPARVVKGQGSRLACRRAVRRQNVSQEW